MSRHSKWSKVKQFKGAVDAKRSASFTKLARELTVAAREKGGDPNMNIRLRVAIERAKKASMPKDSIDRAVQRGAGTSEEGQIESLTYEAYAPGGTALIIECLTDNRNRTANDVKHILSEHGASLAGSGAVTYLFDRFGVVRIAGATHASPLPDNVELALIDAGASDIVEDENGTDVRCAPNDLAKVAAAVGAIHELPLHIESADFEWVPKALVETDAATGTKVAELVEELEGHDDVSRVYSNIS